MIYVFSGDKQSGRSMPYHCSCGRDLAIEELKLLRAGLLEAQRPKRIKRQKLISSLPNKP
jgi:hypothetical protein